jgi:hypothetical protein
MLAASGKLVRISRTSRRRCGVNALPPLTICGKPAVLHAIAISSLS